MENINPPSPTKTVTGVIGSANFAPIALGSALPRAQNPTGWSHFLALGILKSKIPVCDNWQASVEKIVRFSIRNDVFLQDSTVFPQDSDAFAQEIAAPLHLGRRSRKTLQTTTLASVRKIVGFSTRNDVFPGSRKGRRR